MTTKRQLPTHLPILGEKWPIIESRGHTKNFGVTRPAEREVVIHLDAHDKFPRNGVRSTLFHESMHVALEVAGLGNILDDKVEEAVVTCLEAALWPLIESGFFVGRCK